MKVQRECIVCRNVFEVDSSRLKHGRGQCCSRECQYKSVSLKNRSKLPDGSPAPLTVTLTCAECGNEFSVGRDIYDRSLRIGSPTRFCSVTCRANSQEVKNAVSIGLKNSAKFQASKIVSTAKMIETVRSPEHRAMKADIAREVWSDPDKRANIMDGIHERSLNPDWQASPQFQTGENHPAFVGGHTERYTTMGRYSYRQWKKAVFERDNYTCQKCGAHGEGVILHAHHKKSYRDFPELRLDLDNGLTYCDDCHRKNKH